MIDKKRAKQRRAARGRYKAKDLGKKRICITRSSKHISAQLLSEDGGTVLAASSTMAKDLRGDIKYSGNCDAAKLVGADLAKKAVANGHTDNLAFDCSGNKYHGRVKALADAAREGGMNF